MLVDSADKHGSQEINQEERNEGRKVDEPGSWHDPPNRCNDRLGDLDQNLRNRPAPGRIEPGENGSGDDGNLHDLEKGQENVEHKIHRIKPPCSHFGNSITLKRSSQSAQYRVEWRRWAGRLVLSI